MINPKLRLQTFLLLFTVGLGVGVLFSIQIKSPPSRVLNPVTPYITLVETKDLLEKDNLDLKSQIATLSNDINNQQNGIKSNKKSSKDIIDQVEKLKKEVGLTAITGKGLVITLADSEKGEPTIDSIIHAADLRDLVNLIWANKAQAISINDQRLVSTTSIDSIVNTILVNNTKIANPFVIKVIGDQEKLRQVLDSGDFLKDIHRRIKSNGLIFNIESVKEVNIDSYEGGFVVNNAKIKD